MKGIDGTVGVGECAGELEVDEEVLLQRTCCSSSTGRWCCGAREERLAVYRERRLASRGLPGPTRYGVGSKVERCKVEQVMVVNLRAYWVSELGEEVEGKRAGGSRVSYINYSRAGADRIRPCFLTLAKSEHAPAERNLKLDERRAESGRSCSA